MKVEYLNHMGQDLDVVNDARVSFAKFREFFDDSKDPRLIHYLADHDHWSPFAHSFVKFRVTAPVFVARQLVKHQVGFVWNEESRRYVRYTPTFWKPSSWRSAVSNKKQGSGDVLHGWKAYVVQKIYEASCSSSRRCYEALLRLGVCEEQARSVLPVSHETTWIWTGSLYGWYRVASLRLDSHAQAECAEVVQPIADKCSELFPHAWASLRREGLHGRSCNI